MHSFSYTWRNFLGLSTHRFAPFEHCKWLGGAHEGLLKVSSYQQGQKFTSQSFFGATIEIRSCHLFLFTTSYCTRMSRRSVNIVVCAVGHDVFPMRRSRSQFEFMISDPHNCKKASACAVPIREILRNELGENVAFLLWGLRHHSTSFVPDTFLDWIPTFKATDTGKLIIYQERPQVPRHAYCTDGQCFKAAKSHILTTRTKAPPQSESIAIRLDPFYLQILLCEDSHHDPRQWCFQSSINLFQRRSLSALPFFSIATFSR